MQWQAQKKKPRKRKAERQGLKAKGEAQPEGVDPEMSSVTSQEMQENHGNCKGYQGGRQLWKGKGRKSKATKKRGKAGCEKAGGADPEKTSVASHEKPPGMESLKAEWDSSKSAPTAVELSITCCQMHWTCMF